MHNSEIFFLCIYENYLIASNETNTEVCLTVKLILVNYRDNRASIEHLHLEESLGQLVSIITGNNIQCPQVFPPLSLCALDGYI